MLLHLYTRRHTRAIACLCLWITIALVYGGVPSVRIPDNAPLVVQAQTPSDTNLWRYYLPSLGQPIPDTETYLAGLDSPDPHPTMRGDIVLHPSQEGAAHEEPSPQVRQPAEAQATKPLPPEIAGATDSCANVVQRVGDRLFLNGEPFTFVGTNVSYLLEDYFPEEEVPKIMAYLSNAGVTALRIWLFPQHDYDRAERLLDLGREYDIRFVVTLVNYYYDKGAWWFDPMHYEKEYLPHVRDVVARFSGRPEILMWTLMNEPNCSTDTTGSCPGNMVRWATVVSEEIKRLSPCHLVTTGTIRVDPTEEHYRNLHAIPTIDVVSIHRAADLWLEKEIQIARELAKPVLLGEVYARAYGRSCDLMADGILEKRAELIAADMERSWAEGVDGYLLWQYGHGRLEVGDQVQYYCEGYDYLRGDPIWSLMASAPVSRVPLP